MLLRGGRNADNRLKEAQIGIDSSSDESEDETLSAEIIDIWEKVKDASNSTRSVIEPQCKDTLRLQSTWNPSNVKAKLLPLEDADALDVQAVAKPLDYLKKYFDEQHFVDVAFYSNIYFLNKTGHELKTSATEMKKFYGALMIMG